MVSERKIKNRIKCGYKFPLYSIKFQIRACFFSKELWYQQQLRVYTSPRLTLSPPVNVYRRVEVPVYFETTFAGFDI